MILGAAQLGPTQRTDSRGDVVKWRRSFKLPDHLGLAREAPHRRGENQDRLDEESDGGHDEAGLRAVEGAHERAERGADRLTHTIGPAPSRKKLTPARTPAGTQIVSTSTTAAARPVTGPSPTTTPNGSARMMGGASSAPATIPTPYVASVAPTPKADRPSRWTA